MAETALQTLDRHAVGLTALAAMIAVIIGPIIQYVVGLRQARGAALSGQSVATLRALQSDLAEFIQAVFPASGADVNRERALRAFLSIKLQLDLDDEREAVLLEQLATFLAYLNRDDFTVDGAAEKIDAIQRQYKQVEAHRQRHMLR